jgi:hypothetical protein
MSRLEWYLELAGNAIDASRYEHVILRHLEEDLVSSKEVLKYLVKNKKLVRVEWGGDDVRYYYPGEIAFRGVQPGFFYI